MCMLVHVLAVYLYVCMYMCVHECVHVFLRVYMSMCVLVHMLAVCLYVCMCVHAYLCALLVHKYQNLGSHNFYFSFNCANSIFLTCYILFFVVAIIYSTKTGPK